jgi:hypothetical protein
VPVFAAAALAADTGPAGPSFSVLNGTVYLFIAFVPDKIMTVRG